MATERWRQVLLGGLVVALLVVLGRLWTPATSTQAAATSNGPVSGTAAPRQQQTSSPSSSPAPRPAPVASAAAGPPSVHLDALDGKRPTPEAAERNLFRFKTKAPPPAPPAPVRPVPPVMPTVMAPTGPPPPPPLAPITLKFIGVVEAPAHGEKIAILSDGRNAPFYGKEGAIIEGRYRILKIGVESVELAYADGRGRQTIRLTGS